MAPKKASGGGGGGGKKDKKAKQGAADEDDFDTILQEAKVAAPEPEAAANEATSKGPAETSAPAKEAANEDGEGGSDDEGGNDGGLDAKTLANRKKKEKKKAKKAEVTGGEGMWGGGAAPSEAAPQAETAETAAEAPAKAEPAKPEAKKGGKEKKESATVKAARERLEMERKLREEREAFEAAERKRIEEEERLEREENERLEAERQRKRDARAAKIQKQKEEGTYKSKAEKLRIARAAQLREQFGFNLEEFKQEEAEEAAAEAAAAEAAKSKRPLATKLKKTAKQKGAEDGEPDVKAEAPEPAAQAKEAAEPAKQEPEPAQADEDDDDWEKAAEKLEAKDETGDANDNDDKESDSGSSSSSSSSSSSDDFPGYRSPIVCIMGHVDTGKTKLLDKIRRTNVQQGEAGGITQQIGATFFPDIALEEQTKKVDPEFEIEVPGLLIIDTPGHESFNNLRARGSSLCDLAILVIDIMHGLEPQTVESLEMLKKRKCPFVIAMNKIDLLYQWNSKSYTGVREALDRQESFVMDEFHKRFSNVMLQLNERGLNCRLYWENEDLRTNVSIVPTSAMTGEGVPDLLYMLLNLTQSLMSAQLEVEEDLQCTVIEVKNIEGLGTTIDVILKTGKLREGDTIVLAGMSEPIVTTIRALLTPQPMKEMRVKGDYIHHSEISTSMGVKICAPGLEEAVCGTELLVKGPDDDLEELKEEVQEGFESILRDLKKQAAGVYVKASTLGSLEALLSFLQDMKIPVFDVGIGEVHKKDVKKAMIMKEKKHPEYAVILAFDVKVNAEAKQQADHDGVQIFTADIIYHLEDKFKTYMQKVNDSKKTETRHVAVFPVVLQIDSKCVFRKHDPLLLGCNVVGGQLRLGTPICVPEKDSLVIGHVAGIERDKKPVEVARRGASVCVKIEQNTAQKNIAYGRHFDHTNQLYSHITRASIDTLKEHFKDEMQKEDWELIIGMKKVFDIQ